MKRPFTKVGGCERPGQEVSFRVDGFSGRGAGESTPWIWDHGDGSGYNLWRLFRRSFESGAGGERLWITADTRYRLWVNGRWVLDGPVRGWPDALSSDWLDLGDCLKPGRNEIQVLVHFPGTGHFHGIPQRGALAAILFEGAGNEIFRSDESWEVAEANEFAVRAPRISVQLPQVEIVDARLSASREWRAARPIAAPHPWSLGRPRSVQRPMREAVEAPEPLRCGWVKSKPEPFSVPLLHLLYPGVILVSVHLGRGMALAAEVEVEESGLYSWFLDGMWDVWIDGQKIEGNKWRATEGRHRVVSAVRELFSDRVDVVFGWPRHENLRWFAAGEHPEGREFSWTALVPEEFKIQGNDLYWVGHPSKFLEALVQKYAERKTSWGQATESPEKFGELVAREGRWLDADELFYPDPDAAFRNREPAGEFTVEKKVGGGWRVPLREGFDAELAFDLGDQFAGFVEMEIDAPAGTVVDLSLVEFIREDGAVQHTSVNRNCFRYVAREGRQRFLSFQRRSGRFVFLTVRGGTAPVTVLELRVLESRYPAESGRGFVCSDEELNTIWLAAHRTMQLSMDDVFIDSLYEQTLWVGDAKVEQLYALWNYDARDISLQSMRLAAQSAFRAPMVLSQVPSSWENILPTWSFLWVMSVWDYYSYSGEVEVVREMWPAIRKTIRGAASQLNGDDLFDAPWWNLFEWADVDNGHRCVLFVSLFLAGALRAAENCAEVLGDEKEAGWLRGLRRRLQFGIDRMWDEDRGLYVESLHADGKRSDRFSIHPQFLAVLFDACDRERGKKLLDRSVDPEEGVEGIASPFALQFLFEALEKDGRHETILSLTREYFRPMVATGTTLWEALPGSRTTPPGFPTRSHCHGWSCAPLYFLHRILLGIRQTIPGGTEFEISPRLSGLSLAEGSVATPHGRLRVRWQVQGELLEVAIEAPAKVQARFARNESHEGLRVSVNDEAEGKSVFG